VITAPAHGAQVQNGLPVTITGTASDAGGVVAGVEISVDGGATWRNATGRTSWSFSWTPVALGATTVLSRGFDDTGNMETAGSPPSSNAVQVDVVPPPLPSCPCTIFPASDPPVGAVINDGAGIELGVKFRAVVDGYVGAVRFWKGVGDIGPHVVHLWTESGELLAEATFSNDAATGWQMVPFSSAVAITAGPVYIASYHDPVGWYTENHPYFTEGITNLPLRALPEGEAGSNGVYAYSSTPVFPTQSFQSSNYWVDVVFTTTPVGVPENHGPPVAFALHRGVPNPFTRSTVLAFDLPRAEHVRIDVLDMGGRRVRTLLAESRPSGRHSVTWDGRDERGRRAPAGVYLYRMKAGAFASAGRRLVLLP
jgi:hypothetical protein